MEEAFDIESLKNFVSDEIYAFLTSDDKPSTSGDSASTCSASMLNSADPYPQNETHLLEAEIDRLLLECSLQYDQQERPGDSIQQVEPSADKEKSKNSSAKRPFAIPRKRLAKLKTEPSLGRLLKILTIVLVYGISGVAIVLVLTATR